MASCGQQSRMTKDVGNDCRHGHKNFPREKGSSDLHRKVSVFTQCFRLQTLRKKEGTKTKKGAAKAVILIEGINA